MNTHKTIIHAKCPINGLWDYYDVILTTPCFIKAEDVDAAANKVRGFIRTQEEIAEDLFKEFDLRLGDFTLTVSGRHGQNVQTTVEHSKEAAFV